MQVLKAFLSLDTRVYYGLALLTLLYMFYVGSLTSPIIVFIFVLCTGCMIFTAYLAQWVLAKDEGPLEMSEVCSCSHIHAFSVSRLIFFSCSPNIEAD